MLPALGGGSTLRFELAVPRQLQPLRRAEWRGAANRFLDMAVFYDAGKVMSRREGSASKASRVITVWASGCRASGDATHRVREKQRGSPRVPGKAAF
jgi:hypothetical protein